MFQTPNSLQNETFQNINETFVHWSDEYSSGIQALIFTLEVIEWIFLLHAVAGMYFGIEIGHPSKNYSQSSYLYMILQFDFLAILRIYVQTTKPCV